jgi:pantothenate kinase-related protein Tda10
MQEKIKNRLMHQSMLMLYKRYNIEYDDATICGICGTEGSRKTTVPIKECHEILDASRLSDVFSEKLDMLLTGEQSNKYDKAFAKQLKEHFTDGLLNDIENICKSCYKELSPNKTKKKKGTYRAISVHEVTIN